MVQAQHQGKTRSPRVAVTGATGFVGRALVSRLLQDGCQVIALTRRPVQIEGAEAHAVGDLAKADELQHALAGVDTVFHLAARAHVLDESPGADVVALYRTANVEATVRVASAAIVAGVRRFIFVSSVKVLGESTGAQPFTQHTLPQPADPYALSKWQAEQRLSQLMQNTRMESVIIRSPLVYGPGVGANFARLMRLVASGIPLPLGLVRNRRSMIALDNLVDLLVHCIQQPQAAGQTLLVSDGRALSTPELIRLIAAAMGRSPRLLPLPGALLRAVGAMTGRRAEIDRLCGSLEVDDQLARELLGWYPPTPVEEGVRRAVGAFMLDGKR